MFSKWSQARLVPPCFVFRHWSLLFASIAAQEHQAAHQHRSREVDVEHVGMWPLIKTMTEISSHEDELLDLSAEDAGELRAFLEEEEVVRGEAEGEYCCSSDRLCH